MAKSSTTIADKIIGIIRTQGTDHVTINWKAFYELAERTRIKDAFMVSLKKEFKKKSFLMADGDAVVVISKDFDSHPIKLD
jgi:hypothetical protein